MTPSLGVDIRMLNHTGIGTYLKGICQGFADQARHDLCFYGLSEHDNPWNSVRHANFFSRIYSVEEQAEYPYRLRECRLWHAPHYNVPVYKGKTKLVVTIHDLIHWIFRHDFFSPLQAAYAGFMFRRAVGEADHIIAVSERTKADLIEHMNADAEKISVIYEAVESDLFLPCEEDILERTRKKYHLPESYFLYVGMLKPHKNVAWLIKLYKELRRHGQVESSLVLIGRVDSKYKEVVELLGRLRPEDGIVHLPYVEREELKAILKLSQGLLHPSLYEGFGLTLLEAMAVGTPVIALAAGSVPEVTGKAAYLVNSGSCHEMKDAITRMEKVPELRREHVRLGREQARHFSWEETVEKTLNVYERVLRS